MCWSHRRGRKRRTSSGSSDGDQSTYQPTALRYRVNDDPRSVIHPSATAGMRSVNISDEKQLALALDAPIRAAWSSPEHRSRANS